MGGCFACCLGVFRPAIHSLASKAVAQRSPAAWPELGADEFFEDAPSRRVDLAAASDSLVLDGLPPLWGRPPTSPLSFRAEGLGGIESVFSAGCRVL